MSHTLPTANDVEAYLQQHPEFFHEHVDLLEQLSIPHPSGVAVSLITKQLELLRNKHREQEHQLTELIEIARNNDTAFLRLHQLTLALLNSTTLEDAVVTLERVLTDFFLTDFVEVRLIQPYTDESMAHLFIDPDSEDVKPFMKELTCKQTKCARPTLAQAKILFGDLALEVNSCAIVPMMLGESAGILAIGSREQGRFHYSMGQLFLTQIGEIVEARLFSLLQLAS
ncbi:MAG: DUF484 family protein [Methylococcaceae bacterium]|nr:DUF484 family protein [Methylococcaceae bacterium]